MTWAPAVMAWAGLALLTTRPLMAPRQLENPRQSLRAQPVKAAMTEHAAMLPAQQP